jgi:predicted nucleic acid-binding protein
MTGRFFVDTNVLIYAASNAAEDQSKRAVALQVLSLDGIAFSAQVAQEFYYAATRKKHLQVTETQAQAMLARLHDFPVLPISLDLIQAAVILKARWQTSYWDAAILAAAKALRCTHVFSEDLNHGQDYDGVKVINPFV